MIRLKPDLEVTDPVLESLKKRTAAQVLTPVRVNPLIHIDP